MSKNPLVSVCIPVYNGEKYIAETIQSVLAQTYANIEIVVQDNASTDSTWSLLQEFAARYPQILIHGNAQNCGMAANWNLVINRASGDYIMLLSADDLLGSTFVASCLSTFSERVVDAVTANHFNLKDGRLVKRKMLLRSGAYENFCHIVLLLNPFSINFTLFSRELVDRMRVGGNLFARSFYTCDYDLWIRLSLAGARVTYLDKCLGTYRVHGENLSRQVRRMSRQTSLVLLSHKVLLKSHCSKAYRFTLFRFILRSLRNAVRYGVVDGRMLRTLVAELIRG